MLKNIPIKPITGTFVNMLISDTGIVNAGLKEWEQDFRMMKEIGIFSIAVPVIGLVMSVVIRLVVGAEAAEISVSQSGFFMGVIVLCLTQFFIHGAQLEEDVEGLL